jgi:hypothetical protein
VRGAVVPGGSVAVVRSDSPWRVGRVRAAALLAGVVGVAAASLLLWAQPRDQGRVEPKPPALSPGERPQGIEPGERRALDGRVGLAGFDELNAQGGDLSQEHGVSAPQTQVAQARVVGGSGVRVARGLWDVHWRPGSVVCFGASFNLPEAAFFDSLQDSVDVLRWDDFRKDPLHTDHGGLSIWPDGGVRLFRERLRRQHAYQVLLGPYWPRHGQWIRLAVEQRLSDRAGEASSKVFVDGSLVGSTASANAFGRPVSTVRYGIVSVHITRQRSPVALSFSQAFVVDGPCRPDDLGAPS